MGSSERPTSSRHPDRSRHAFALPALLIALTFPGPAARAGETSSIPPLRFTEVVVPDVVTGYPHVSLSGDVTGDGLTDLTWILSHPMRTRTLAGDGTGGFVDLGEHPLSVFGVWDAGMADMDADGFADLVVNNTEDDLIVLLGAGDGSFAFWDTQVASVDGNRVLLEDVDRDGDVDVVLTFGDAFLADPGVHVATNDGDGRLSVGYHFEFRSVYGRVDAIGAGDLDGDGILDLVIAADRWGPGTDALLLPGLGGADFGDPILLLESGQSGMWLQVGDVDADGWPDIVASVTVVPGGDPDLITLLNLGGGTFDAPRTVGSGWIRSLPELNGDGHLDALVTLSGGSGSRVARGLGDGTFLPNELVPSSHPQGVPRFAGRVDQDLGVDLFAPIEFGTDLVLLLNEQPGSPFATSGPPLAGVAGEPRLSGRGSTTPGAALDLILADAAPTAPCILVAGTSLLGLPLLGGLLTPEPQLVLGGLDTSATGGWSLGATWPPGVPLGVDIHAQTWIVDDANPLGWSASNGLRITAG